MAAPTNVRVEANSLSTTTIRWSYAGSNQIAVYRSTDGSAYAEVTGAGSRVAVGTTSYNDTGLSAGTKYWYKLSDDGGSTFSSVVTVWTHGCPSPAVGGDGFSLPRMSHGGGDPVDEFNNAAERIENVLQGRVLDPSQCAACPDDGRLVLDCSDGCRDFAVIVDRDINSISLQMCDEGEGNIDFIIPPNETRRFCGFPAGFGFTGDECTDSPISGGTDGRTVSVPFGGGGRANPGGTKSRPGYGAGVGRGGGGGGAGCTCVPGGEGQLTIKSCNAGNSLKCGSTKSARFLACGGVGPYTWSKTGTVTLSSTTGESTSVTPPANTGSSVVGTAYSISCFTCNGANCSSGVCANAIGAFNSIYNCNDSWDGDPNGCGGTGCGPTPSGSALNKCCNNNTNQCANNTCLDLRNGGCTGITQSCDKRTAQMISDGCNPCGLAAAGATLTVTDAVGNSVTITLAA